MTSILPRTPEENARRVHAVVEPLARASAHQPVFLVDGDRTLSPDDTSRALAERAGVDHGAIKRRFQRDGYVFDAFRFHAAAHVRVGEVAFAALAAEVAERTSLHEGAVEFLASAARRGRVFVVSAGIPRIWSNVLRRHGLDDVGVIGGIDPSFPYVFGRAEKGQVAELFRRHAAAVVGVGDSDVDTEMLRRADHAVVVVNRRRNVDLLPGLVGHRSLWQVAPLGDAHADLPCLSFEEILALADVRAPELDEVQACP